MMKLIYLSKENFVRDSGYDNELTYQLKWCYVYFSKKKELNSLKLSNKYTLISFSSSFLQNNV